MAERPIFIAETGAGSFVDEAMLSIQWNAGFSEQQKKKNVGALHNAASRYSPNIRMLEVSTKSSNPIGQKLSAFNLSLQLPNNRTTRVECAFQGSKVFSRGGPFIDLYDASAIEAKRDPRLRECGDLIGFDYFGMKWGLSPKTAFYDWLYMQALHKSELASEVFSYDGFTDIEFNPKKSFSCQARAVAMYVAIMKREGEIDFSPDSFARYYDGSSDRDRQIRLI
jgi:hypothetical protein